MAHHVEPMEIDSESDFDKENTYQHSNVLSRTPCTEKGYEELDVSELNMKLRYSVTPAASPMSKSMSVCPDNRYNASMDESLNNTVINENENNLTRSLNSTLSKTDVSVKALPLQTLQSDLLDSNRNSSVLRSLDATITNDVTVTVSNDNQLDCLSIPSSSSSIAHTPEATTPTKEIPKSDGGSPIMRGLKSVLSMFRSSQSPIPPSEADNNSGSVLSPEDVPLPNPKPHAIASTPNNQKVKERSLSRNSPHKESIVFNDDLEKELQWNDDSTIVFSSEKIPIHKLFFQDKPSGSKINDMCQSKKEEPNSSVEYMDVSYNDLSIRDRTLNGTANISKVIDVVESDGEFVDCETTFTQEESQTKMKHEKVVNDSSIKQDVQDFMIEKQVPVHPIMDATQDIINLIDSTQFATEIIEAEKQLDFSSTDIVNKLSELINASETETYICSEINSEEPHMNEPLKKMSLQAVEAETLENSVTDLKNVINTGNLTNMSIVNDTISDLNNVDPEHNTQIQPPIAELNSVNVEVSSPVCEITSQSDMHRTAKAVVITEINNGNEAVSLSPADIPLPIEDDFDKVNDNELGQCTELQDKTIDETVNAPMSDDKVADATDGETISHIDYTNCDMPCPPSLLSSDVSLPNVYDNNLENSLPHEAVTDAPDPILPHTIETPDNTSSLDSFEPIMANTVANNLSVAYSNLKNDNNLSIAHAIEEKMEISFTDQKDKSQEDFATEVSVICESSPAELGRIKDEEISKTIEEIAENREFTITDGITRDAMNENHKNEDLTLPATSDMMNYYTEEQFNTTETERNSNQAIKMCLVEEKSNDASNANETCNSISNIESTFVADSTLRDVINQSSCEKVPDAFTSATMLQAANMSEIEDTSNKDVICTELRNSIDLDINKTLDKSHNTENSQKQEEKMDEEIVVSESNSPFVSVSAEGEFTSEDEKYDFKEVENLPCNKQNKCSSPPSSPKIVSRGYNFNFDDLESMDPFATKTKIRMSPPPPDFNTSHRPLNKNTNISRRKSMPAKKNVLKANKKFNSTFDSTVSAQANIIEATINETEDKEVGLDSDINKQDSFTLRKEQQTVNNVEHYTVQNITLDETVPEVSKQKQKPLEPESLSNKLVPDSNINVVCETLENSTIRSEVAKLETTENNSYEAPTEEFNDIVSKPLKTSTMIDKVEFSVMELNKTDSVDTSNKVDKPIETSTIIEDVIMSSSSKSLHKSGNASSSEQSTYYSAGTSIEYESKNVFNLPEIDDKDFNPFATKSKIRQTPPPDLHVADPFATRCKIQSSQESSFDISHQDANDVTIDNDCETKEATYNLSDCSTDSKTSDERDITVQEVHTEDEDTIEGPFIEAEEDNEFEKSEVIENKRGGLNFDGKNDQAAEDNADAAEMFIDAEAFEFLMNQNKDDEVAYSGKESLFLKFDPLFARRVTAEGVASALNEFKRRQSTPQKTHKEKELISFEKPIAGPSDLNITQEVESAVENNEDMNVTMSKPMMVVPPAVNPVVSPKKYSTPNRTNRLSMTFTSPAMAVIDRLLSLSGSSPSAALDATVTRAHREHNEADQALTQLRELLAEKEINVYNLRSESKELKDRLYTLETQMKTLEAESAERLKKINDLNDNLAEKTKMNRSMAAVVEEYERTIASLISETEQDKKRYAEERNQLIKERDEQTTHLTSMEVSFSDLHSKYEKSKQIIMGYKTNEDAYKNSLKEFEDNLAKMQSNYEQLKQHATSKLNHANQELEKLNKAHEAEVLKMNAMIKRKDLHITSLEESLAQKTKANEELTAICDELINKVG